MASMIGGLIQISIGIVVFAQVFMHTLKNTSTSEWGASEVALWGILGIVGIAGIANGVANMFGLGF